MFWRKSSSAATAAVTETPAPLPFADIARNEHERQLLVKIAALRCVSKLSIVETSWERWSYQITFYPLVLDGLYYHYLLGPLTLLVPTHPCAFEMPTWKSQYRGQRLHPHIDSMGRACWGNGEAPIRTALEDGDVLMVIILAAGWARQRNRFDPLARIHPFPRTHLPIGWQVPIGQHYRHI